jgi:Fe-S-cluster-containing hydrogenase component 2
VIFLVRVLLRFSEEIVNKPITSQIILEEGIPLNILSARIDQGGGEIIIDIPSDRANDVITSFKERGVEVIIHELIEVNDDLCFDCGACLSLCPVSAITQETDLSISFDKEKCVGITCGLCVNTCPTRAIRLTE